jgi:hypothetical protein
MRLGRREDDNVRREREAGEKRKEADTKDRHTREGGRVTENDRQMMEGIDDGERER